MRRNESESKWKQKWSFKLNGRRKCVDEKINLSPGRSGEKRKRKGREKRKRRKRRVLKKMSMLCHEQ